MVVRIHLLKRSLQAIGGFLIAMTVSAEPQVLTAVEGSFVIPPAIIRATDPAKNTGYLIDIYRELSAQLGMQLQLKPFPRSSVAGALLRSEADIYCRANPAWYPNPLLRWSPALFSFFDLLLSHQPLPDLSSLAQQPRVIATVAGYKYVELEAVFRSGHGKRQDYASPDEAAAAFLAGKTDSVVLSEIEAHYLLPVNRLHQLELGHYQLHCMYSPRLKSRQRQLLDNYIRARAASGDFKALLQKYSWQLDEKQPVKSL